MKGDVKEFVSVSFPTKLVVEEIDSRRGLVPRSTFLQALVKRALAAGLDSKEAA